MFTNAILDRVGAVVQYFLTQSLRARYPARGSIKGGSVAEWLACWTQAQKGPGSNRSRDAVG